MDRAVPFFAAFALALGAAPAVAQFDNRWVEFVPAGPALAIPGLSSPAMTVRLAAGDLDLDGDPDLVLVRKQSFSGPGKRPNVLLMNQGGTFVDATAALASASSVAGDAGFVTPTNDSAVEIADVDQDGRPDVVTAVTLSDGDPKHIGHPRVYRNLGFSGAGAWLGLRHEDARIPQLLHFGTGLPQNPRFTDVAAGDVTADGYPDLYFIDHDTTTLGGPEPVVQDLNDRLLVNDGFGFFSDATTQSLTTAMAGSSFGIACSVADLNGDAFPDVLKQQGGQVSALYNRPSVPGNFVNLKNIYHNAAYSMGHGDLNNDGRIDVVVGDDLTDRVIYNLATDVNQVVTWSAPTPFQFLSGADDGFVGPIHVADLDGDGFRDVLIADVDLELPGFTRRMHVYHNPGGAPGSTIQLIEERQQAGAGGWVGAVGFAESDLMGTFDVISLDHDGDGDRDLVVGRSTGTRLWENRTVVCQTDLGFAGPGSAQLTLCGDVLASGGTATLSFTGALPGATAWLVVGTTAQPVAFLSGVLVPNPIVLLVPVVTNGQGEFHVPNVPGGFGPTSVYVQVLHADAALPGGLGFSNALQVDFVP